MQMFIMEEKSELYTSLLAMAKGAIPVNCTSFDDGEVEDYTVRISKLPIVNSVNQTDILIYPNPVKSVLNVKNISEKAKL